MCRTDASLYQTVSPPAPDTKRYNFPTAPGGREWIAKWAAARTVNPYELDPRDPLCRNSADVPLRIGREQVQIVITEQRHGLAGLNTPLDCA